MVLSQVITSGQVIIGLLSMFALSFLMIHVGYEFEIDKSRPSQYAWDYIVAATAAAFPWVLCSLYFIFVMAPPEMWSSLDLWKESLLQSRFASPTSAGVLFSMMAAAGLAATWVFQKARVLAIFDDLDTILFMIPLKMLLVGFRWQLIVVVFFISIFLVLAWRYMHRLRVPVTWPYVMGYALGITALCQAIHFVSCMIDHRVPIHLEVLLPAFVLGCMLARPKGVDVHAHDAVEGHEEGPDEEQEQFVSTIMSGAFMVLVGLSMPLIVVGGALPANHFTYAGVADEVVAQKYAFPGWGMIIVHVLAITLLANLGKMFPLLCYRKEATMRERLALCFAMFPRGEVGGGVLVISIAYGIGGPALTVASLSLALNLLGTGLFILVVKRLLAAQSEPASVAELGTGSDRDIAIPVPASSPEPVLALEMRNS
jgi:Kef-type K+ transport system membrane component KefB